MPPSSNGPEMNDSILEQIWKITIEFLLNHGFLVQRTIKNLSINQIKTIYNLHIKHEVSDLICEWSLDFTTQCGNFMILLPLRFYFKSNFGKLKRQKMSFMAILDLLNFDFDEVLQVFKDKIYTSHTLPVVSGGGVSENEW